MHKNVECIIIIILFFIFYGGGGEKAERVPVAVMATDGRV